MTLPGQLPTEEASHKPSGELSFLSERYRSLASTKLPQVHRSICVNDLSDVITSQTWMNSLFKESRPYATLSPSTITTLFLLTKFTSGEISPTAEIPYQAVPIDDNREACRVFPNRINMRVNFTAWSRAEVVQVFQHFCFGTFQLLLHSFRRFRVDNKNFQHFVSQKLATVTNVDCSFCKTWQLQKECFCN